jgi:hypothetical protein
VCLVLLFLKIDLREGSEPEVVSPLSQLPAMAAAMSPVTGGYGGRGGGTTIYNTITVHATGNVTESNEKLGDIVSKALLDKMKGQGKLG